MITRIINPTMEVHKLSVIIYLLPALLSAETVYKSVDEKGQVLFTDMPPENAEKITIEEPNIISISAPEQPDQETANRDRHTSYTTLEIVNPVDDQIITGTQGNFTVDVTLKPDLAEQDELVLLMDGKVMQSGKITRFVLSNIDRGAHTLEVAVRNDKEKLSKRSQRSQGVTVHIRRTAKLDTRLVPDPDVVTPLNPPKPPKPEVSPLNPPKPKPTE